jgi:hypothetical protein
MMTCEVCGTGIEFADEQYNVMIQRTGQLNDRLTEILLVCGTCLNRPLADVVEAARRKNTAMTFEAQAGREVKDLTRDPGKCQQWIREKQRWNDTRGGYDTIDGHYCTRNAVRDGYCKQHERPASG